MKTIVYIDGQNFLYKAAEVLIEAGKIKEKQDLHTLNFRPLLENLLEETDTEIRFYGTKLKRYKSPTDIAEKSTKMVDTQRRLRNCLNSQKIIFIESGKLKLRDGDVCKNCGQHDLHFQEKGVDVRIAVDITNDSYGDEAEKLVLVSSDTDLIPAVNKALEKGKKVVYIGFGNKLTKAIVATASETQIIRDVEIIESFVSANIPTLPV